MRRLFSLPTIVNALGDTTSTPGNATFRIEHYGASGGARARFATGPVGHTLTLQAMPITNGRTG
ncbi:hypothetical protein JMJ56_16150 [Belnapia sp. T18]|uniref:Uncharacterized protein n=1 Tax=Belnapia arida TaxID=2804533 RepID=A0ABS1U4E2_9PROT|nr:hypothetical protein [Belnapia arida]MBL6079550.1 hypothetical protein [Belnapia arida]